MGDETKLEVGAANSAANDLTQAASAWRDTWAALQGEISGLEGNFGGDELGAQLKAQYQPGADQLKGIGGTPADGWLTYGEGGLAAVSQVVQQDAANGRSMPA